MLLARLGRNVFSRVSTPRARMFVRNHYRKWCPDTEVPTDTRYGFKMAVSPHDYASYGIYFFGDYDPRMTDVVRHTLRPGQTVWDIGGERGWFTLLMGRIVGQSGRVDSFEAFPANAARLRANVALNNMGHVHVHEAAVSDAPGVVRFEPPSDAVTGNVDFLTDCSGVGYVTTDASATAIEVPAITLDDHAEKAGLTSLSFIKMDIEGAEVRALRGAEKTLRRFRPIIAVEYNRGTAKRAGTSLEELDGLLDSFGYERFVFNRNFRPLDLSLSHGKPDEEVVFNVYCFPR